MEINNPISQLAKMYSRIEAHLRRAAHDNRPMTLKELQDKVDIVEIQKNKWQARDVVYKLRRLGHVIESTKGGRGHEGEFMWDVSSPPFVWGKRVEVRKKVDPSKPLIVNSEPDLPTPVPANFIKLGTDAAPPKEIELVFGKNQIVIGTNPATGRMRIIIEETP